MRVADAGEDLAFELGPEPAGHLPASAVRPCRATMVDPRKRRGRAWPARRRKAHRTPQQHGVEIKSCSSRRRRCRRRGSIARDEVNEHATRIPRPSGAANENVPTELSGRFSTAASRYSDKDTSPGGSAARRRRRNRSDRQAVIPDRRLRRGRRPWRPKTIRRARRRHRRRPPSERPVLVDGVDAGIGDELHETRAGTVGDVRAERDIGHPFCGPMMRTRS